MKLLPCIWTGYKPSVVLEELVAMMKDVHTSDLIRGCVSHEIFVSLGEYQRRIRAWMHTGAEEDVQGYKYLNRIVLSPQTDYEERRRREDIFSFSYA
jgi:hypothetical protein